MVQRTLFAAIHACLILPFPSRLSTNFGNIDTTVSCARLGQYMKLLDRVSDVGTRKHLAASTIECYRRWVREFLASANWQASDAAYVSAQFCHPLAGIRL